MPLRQKPLTRWTERNDDLIDATLLARYQYRPINNGVWFLPQKNRVPQSVRALQLGSRHMATTMIGWYGDGNGYVGNPDLKPETAHPERSLQI